MRVEATNLLPKPSWPWRGSYLCRLQLAGSRRSTREKSTIKLAGSRSRALAASTYLPAQVPAARLSLCLQAKLETCMSGREKRWESEVCLANECGWLQPRVLLRCRPNLMGGSSNSFNLSLFYHHNTLHASLVVENNASGLHDAETRQQCLRASSKRQASGEWSPSHGSRLAQSKMNDLAANVNGRGFTGLEMSHADFGESCVSP